MNEPPNYWILNPMSPLFKIIPKKLQPLEEKNNKKNENFSLNQLVWIPRNIKMTPQLIRKFSNDLKKKNSNKFNKKCDKHN